MDGLGASFEEVGDAIGSLTVYSVAEERRESKERR
jgi:hypothetical protein